jgi:outer membrane protein, heavy metal efflux system
MCISYSCRLMTRLLFASLMLMALPLAAESPALPTEASKAPLSLQDAMHLATRNQPLLQSFADAASASREAAIAEGQLPDPKLKLGVVNLPVTTSDALRFDRDEMTMAAIGFSQEVVPRAKREAYARVLESEAEQYQTEQLATVRDIQRSVAMAWLDVFEAQRKSELYQQIVEDMLAERKVAAASVSSGATQSDEVLLLDRTQSMTRDQWLLVQRDERKARAALARWIGPEAASRPISSELPVTEPVAATDALENHPLLQHARQAETLALSELERARTQRLRNWEWEVSYGRRFNDLSDMIAFQVAIDLQTDRANRQDRRAAEKQLLAEKARKLIDDQRRQLSNALQDARADWETAVAREEEHQKRLIPATDIRLSLAEANYAVGAQSLLKIWEARRSVLEVQIEHWTILTDKQRAAVNLGYLLNDDRLFPRSQP